MKAVLVVAIAALLPCLAMPASGADGSPTVPKKPRAAVLDFDVQNGPGNVGAMARDAVSSALVKSGRFEVYERGQISDVLKEHKLPLIGLVDTTTAVKIGRFTGAQIVICGSVQAVSSQSGTSRSSGLPISIPGIPGIPKSVAVYSTTAKVTLHCKAIDASDGSIWREDSVDGSAVEYGTVDSSSLVPRAAVDAAQKFVDKLVPPLKGAVVEVVAEKEGGYFIINLGSNRGVTERSEFRVETDGKVIYDLDGTVIGEERNLVCLAHPIRGGVDEKMTKLAPGQWRQDVFVWSWREQRSRVSEIQRGFRVIAQPREHG